MGGNARYFFLLLAVLFFTNSQGYCDIEIEKPLEGKWILFVIAHQDFRDEEYQVPRDIFDRLGAEIVVASSDTTLAKGALELEVKPDALLGQVDAKDFDALIFVGGPGAVEYFEDKTAHALADTALKYEKVIGAICIAPIILAKAGILEGREATVWGSKDTKSIFKAEGAIYTALPVVTSDKIVTANGPAVAKEFAEEIVILLLKKDENSASESEGSELQD